MKSAARRNLAPSIAASKWKSRMSTQPSLTSELSGNLIDICPVGALTKKPLGF